MKEQDLQRRFLKDLDTHQVYYVKIVVATVAGAPDVIANVNGRFFAIEFKGPKGRMSDLQKYKRDKILASHGNYLLVTPSNYKDSLLTILDIKYSKK